MCEKQWDCAGKKCDCMFENQENISIEEFYKRTRLCECYHKEGVCESTKSDWMSFVDFAELLWHPKVYVYKAALELLHQKKLAEKATVAIPEEIYGIVDWETVNKCNEYIRKELRKRNTGKSKKYYGAIIKRLKYLWKKADSFQWRDEDEWRQFTEILNDKEYCEAIGFESFRRDYLKYSEYLSKREKGKRKYEESYSEENRGDVIPLTIIVSTEDKTMTGRKPVDVLLHDEKSGKSIAVELKRWTESHLKPIRNSDIDPDIEEDKRDKIIGYKLIGMNEEEWDKLHPVIQASYNAMMINKNLKNEPIADVPRPDPTNAEELKRHIEDDIIGNMQGELRCIPLVYLHNQYYDNGLLYQLTKDEEQPLNSLYMGFLANKHGLFSMYTHNKCELMINVIKRFFSEKE